MVKVYPSQMRKAYWPGSDKIDLYNLRNWIEVNNLTADSVKLISTTKPEALIDVFSDIDNRYFLNNPDFVFDTTNGYLDRDKRFYGTSIRFNYEKKSFLEVLSMVFMSINPVMVSDLMIVFEDSQALSGDGEMSPDDYLQFY